MNPANPRTVILRLLILGSLTGSLSATSDNARVLAYYPFEDATQIGADFSGNGLDLVPDRRHPSPGQTDLGVFDRAATFDGTRGLVGSERLFPAGSFSVSLWLKTAIAEESQMVLRKDNAPGYSLEIVDGEPSFYTSHSEGHDRIRPFATVVGDKWHHLALVFDAQNGPDGNGDYSGTATLYLDGCLPRVFENVRYNPLGSGVLFLGRRGEAGFTGAIDEFAVFEGVLNAHEVGALATGKRNPLDVLGYVPSKIVTPPFHCRLPPPEITTHPGPEYGDSNRMFQGIPSVEIAANGRLWAAWYGGGTGEGAENYILLNTSADSGSTWSEIKLVIDPPHRASEPGLWHDPDGRLWLIWNEYPNGLRGTDSRMWAITTDESGKEDPLWSEPRLVWRELNNFNKPIVLSDGTWLWPTGSWNRAFPSRPLLSYDGGETFTPGGRFLSPNREFDEYNVVELTDGRLWLLNRTNAGMVEAFSGDGGLSWTDPEPSKIQHTRSRHFLTRLRSGGLLLVKHGAIDEDVGRSRLMAFISDDDGTSWSPGLMLDERESVSYPDGVQAEDGTIYIIYDRSRQDEKEILLARFREKDLRAGRPVSADASFGLVVNKATAVNTAVYDLLHNGIALEHNPRRRTDLMAYGFDPLPVPYLENPPAVIPIDIGRQLFVDDFLIERTTLARKFHKPVKYPGNPVMAPATELERTNKHSEDIPGATPKSGGVWWDPRDGIFKMWYEAGWLGSLAYATSEDGKHWKRPDLGIVPGTNAILPAIRPDSTTVWLDHQVEDPDARFKLFVRPYSETKHAYIMTSPDGINWSEPVPTGGMGDRSTIFHNPFRDVWVFSLRAGRGEFGRARNYSEHQDFFEAGSLPNQARWLRADKLDPPDPDIGDTPQLYNFDAVAYESLMIGFHQVHRGPHNRVAEQTGEPKITELTLSYSRDGFHWDRPDRDSFIAATRTPGSWERGYIQSVGGICTIVGDELWFYYIGYSGNTDPGLRSRNRMYFNGSTGIAKLRRDGFASMGAGDAGGELITRPLSFDKGRYLFVNVDNPDGELRAEVTDANGAPLDGFALTDCEPVSVDGTLVRVRWKNGNDLSGAQGTPVRFRFHLDNGRLYSFWVSPDESGASGGYVAAGGPGFTSGVDTVGRVQYPPSSPPERMGTGRD